MTLGAPLMLLTLLLVPLAVFGYRRLVGRRSGRAARLAADGLVPITPPRRARVRRHLPFALFVAALAAICVALAQPAMSFALPQREGTVILAFDVSNSMKATDLEPTRMKAAQAAATAFVERQPRTIKVGVVAFGDSALTVLRPTSVKEEALAAIKRLSISGGTSLGQGLFTSLTAIAGEQIVIDERVLESDGGDIDIGYFGSSAIVLLSDGENTTRLDPLKVAEVASTAGVRVHAIGLGTQEGTVVQIDGFNVATALDEPMLTEIANVTDGTYNQAGNAEALNAVYESIDLEFKRVEEERQVTALFAAAAGLLLAVGAFLSIVWFGRVI